MVDKPLKSIRYYPLKYAEVKFVLYAKNSLGLALVDIPLKSIRYYPLKYAEVKFVLYAKNSLGLALVDIPLKSNRYYPLKYAEVKFVLYAKNSLGLALVDIPLKSIRYYPLKYAEVKFVLYAKNSLGLAFGVASNKANAFLFLYFRSTCGIMVIIIHRKWNLQPKFKSRTTLFAFHIVLMPWGERYEWNYSPSSSGQILRQTWLLSWRWKTLNSNQI